MRGKLSERQKPLSRTAGEGGERSEPGEGQQRRLRFGSSPKLTRLARDLRRKSTDTERRLWSALRSRRLHPYKFRRQFAIGPFIVDFACTKCLLIVEADGSQHAGNPMDDRRTAWLEARGWRVLRFWDNDILINIDGVTEGILNALRKREALALPRLRRGPLPLPQCGRGAELLDRSGQPR